MNFSKFFKLNTPLTLFCRLMNIPEIICHAYNAVFISRNGSGSLRYYLSTFPKRITHEKKENRGSIYSGLCL